MSKGKFDIPDRWLQYIPVGNRINSTPFVALKCPLQERFLRKLPVEDQFGPHDVKELLPDVTLIIDLTFTAKYYPTNAFRGLGIEHIKIPCRGHDIPDPALIQQFFEIVDAFISKQFMTQTVGLIGVHCTHGVNRTGYFICSYLINRLGYDVHTAISEFNKARGHEIERKNYIDGLQIFVQYPSWPQEANRDYGGKKMRHKRRNTNWKHYSKVPESESQVTSINKNLKVVQLVPQSSSTAEFSHQVRNSDEYRGNASRTGPNQRQPHMRRPIDQHNAQTIPPLLSNYNNGYRWQKSGYNPYKLDRRTYYRNNPNTEFRSG